MPDTSASLYEQLFPLSTIMGQRFVDNFSGDALDTDRWTTTISGSGTSSMNDTVNGGVLLDASATSGGASTINFNDIRQYSYNSSEIILVSKINEVGVNSFEAYSGFSDKTTTLFAEGAWVYKTHSNANWQLATSSGSFTFTATSVSASNDTYNIFKMVLGGSDVVLTVDGLTGATNTTNLPSTNLQPMIGLNTASNNSKTMNVLYCEAYNT